MVIYPLQEKVVSCSRNSAHKIELHATCQPVTCQWTGHPKIVVRVGLAVSRNYRMLIYQDFQNLEEYIVSNLKYRVF